jgi:hypothetical protein
MSSRPRKLADPAMPAVAPTCVTAALERVGRLAPVSNGRARRHGANGDAQYAIEAARACCAAGLRRSR